jgi:predicted nucleic acid-binding protein
MAILLLDTTVIIDVLRNKRERPNLLRKLVGQGHTLACCPINITEVYAGMRPNEQAATDVFLQSLELIPTTWPVAKLAGDLKRDHSKKGTTLNLGDVIIAATALHNGLPLLTDNIKDFPMKNLTLYPL